MGGTLGLRKGILPWALLCATALCAVPAATRAAAPAVTSGSATVTSSGNTTVIVQTTPKAIYTWQTLNIPAGGLLEFEQQSSSSIALNRVLSGPAIINGSLLSNGQVWIIDPAGVLFGHGASVNVAGLIATTSNISDQNFLNGNFVFDQPTSDAKAALVNDGSIAVGAGGAAVLAGAHVVNNGLIEATLGKVVLAAGSAFTLDFSGDGLISFAVSAPVNVTPLNANGSAAQSLIANSGTLSAPGGEVLLTAQSTRSVLTNVINTTGMIEAVAAHQENGEIVLDAGTGNVTLGPSSVLDASGDQGGGTISVTGGNITVAQGALLNANAVTSGNGGSVTLEASDTLAFNGAITATGGATAGNGGLVDTSGANLSIASGSVDALAPEGSAGTWLLDPTNVIIATGGTGNSGQAGSFGSSPGQTDTIDPSAIDGAKANVVLQATGNVTFANAVTMAKSRHRHRSGCRRQHSRQCRRVDHHERRKHQIPGELRSVRNRQGRHCPRCGAFDRRKQCDRRIRQPLRLGRQQFDRHRPEHYDRGRRHFSQRADADRGERRARQHQRRPRGRRRRDHLRQRGLGRRKQPEPDDRCRREPDPVRRPSGASARHAGPDRGEHRPRRRRLQQRRANL